MAKDEADALENYLEKLKDTTLASAVFDEVIRRVQQLMKLGSAG